MDMRIDCTPDDGGEDEDLPAEQGETVDLAFGLAFKIAEVAKKLDISERQVMGHVRDHTLIAIDMGRGGERRCLRILDEDLEAFVRRRKLGKVPEPAPVVRTRWAKPMPLSSTVSYAERRANRKATPARP